MSLLLYDDKMFVTFIFFFIGRLSLQRRQEKDARTLLKFKISREMLIIVTWDTTGTLVSAMHLANSTNKSLRCGSNRPKLLDLPTLIVSYVNLSIFFQIQC